MLTRLEVFLVSRGIKIADLVKESGYHRSHVLRIRQALIEPSRDAIAAIVSALRRLSHEDVRPEMVFELTREDSGAWRQHHRRLAARELAAYRKERERTGRVLTKLARLPRAEWLTTVANDECGLSAALARAATIEGRRLIDTNAQHSEALFHLAMQIADRAIEITPEYRAFLGGRARLERANALKQLGSYTEALPLLDEAEALFVGVPDCTHDLGRTWLARGSILFKMDGLDEALRSLRLAVNIFAALDDQHRLARVRFVEGNVRFEKHETTAARTVWLGVEPALRTARDWHSLASLWLNLGWCDIELDTPGTAKEWLLRALERFAKLKSRNDVARTHWALALLNARFTDRQAGLLALKRARDEMESLSLFAEAGMADLDRAELLLLEPRQNAVEAASICRGLVQLFRRSGAKKELLRALGYLWEAANTRAATPALVRRIREEVRRADRVADYRFVEERVQ